MRRTRRAVTILRGKRFTIVIAGNPYTESDDIFKIPDMLGNRADIYNLGDVLDGREDVFAMSYIENALVSHPVLQPLAARDPPDVQVNLPDQDILQDTLTRLADSYEQNLLPMLSAMNHKMRLDHGIWDGVRDLSASIEALEQRLMGARTAKEKLTNKETLPAKKNLKES